MKEFLDEDSKKALVAYRMQRSFPSITKATPKTTLVLFLHTLTFIQNSIGLTAFPFASCG